MDEPLNDEKKEIKKESIYIDLDKKRELFFGFRALKLLEERFDQPILRFLTDLQSKVKQMDIPIAVVTALIWAGLQRSDPGISEDQVLDLLDNSEYSMVELVQKFNDAMDAAAAQLKEKKLRGVTLQTVKKK